LRQLSAKNLILSSESPFPVTLVLASIAFPTVFLCCRVRKNALPDKKKSWKSLHNQKEGVPLHPQFGV